MGTVVLTVTHGSKATVTKTYTVPDADVDRFEAAWQSDANVAVNGTATRGQVFLAWANFVIAEVNQKVRAKEQTISSPPPISAV